MERASKIYVAGHRVLVGSALVRRLQVGGYVNLITRTHAELDLTNQGAVASFFSAEKPEYVFLAAAKVGGIHANNTYPADFIYQNLMIETNVIHAAYDPADPASFHPARSTALPPRSTSPIGPGYRTFPPRVRLAAVC